ncbi:MAG: outer membrane protein assembly factor BamA [Acidobacteriota bacterium]
MRYVEIAFPTQNNASVVEPATYLYYIHSRPSRPSVGEWSPYDEAALRDDFRRLWTTEFLDDLWIEVKDVPFENGVIGKHVIFNLSERQRVKIVDYTGSKAIETSEIDEKLKEERAEVRLDTFVDAGMIRKVEGIVRDLMHEKGFQYAVVTHTVREMPGGPKLIGLSFHLDEGPKLKVTRVVFTGNRTVRSRVLLKQLKSTKPRAWWVPPFLHDADTYQDAKFDDDAALIQKYYRDHGYVTTSVGVPEFRRVSDDVRRRIRWIELRIPVSEGKQYQVGELAFEGDTVMNTNALKALFARIKPRDIYREDDLRKALEKAREVYGAGGYFEFTAYPDLKPRDEGGRTGIVDVTMKFQEGRQFFISRLMFSGNTVTHDAVIRRELALVEGGVFNTEALKYSVRRLNQMGYFKPVEDHKNVTVEKAPGSDDHVNVTLKLEEQNRNSVTFGAGVSEYEGLFGNVGFTTSNFLGRGESLSLTAQKGSRASVLDVSFSKPYLFDRPISGGINLYSRKYDYNTSTSTVGYSEVREGTTVTVGRAFQHFTRASIGYTYEVIDVDISKELLNATTGGTAANGTPLFNPYTDNGRHIDSRVTPSLIYNTVDNPIMPHSGKRLTASLQLAGTRLGGSYDYFKSETEAIWWLPTSRQTGFGIRGQLGWLHAYGTTSTLPYYLRYFLGGEYQIRGVDIRTVGPIDAQNRELGGNKSVLFNAEYYWDVLGPVRLLAFHDAGQAFLEKDRIDLRTMRTSSGGELRVLVPMLNVPFRLIYFVNVYRDSFQPDRGFKFAVGTTF